MNRSEREAAVQAVMGAICDTDPQDDPRPAAERAVNVVLTLLAPGADAGGQQHVISGDSDLSECWCGSYHTYPLDAESMRANTTVTGTIVPSEGAGGQQEREPGIYCERRKECEWKTFALDRHGVGHGSHHLHEWRRAHERYCGGRLLPMTFVFGAAPAVQPAEPPTDFAALFGEQTFTPRCDCGEKHRPHCDGCVCGGSLNGCALPPESAVQPAGSEVQDG